jgi:hypothetical protein
LKLAKTLLTRELKPESRASSRRRTVAATSLKTEAFAEQLSSQARFCDLRERTPRKPNTLGPREASGFAAELFEEKAIFFLEVFDPGLLVSAGDGAEEFGVDLSPGWRIFPRATGHSMSGLEC